jgi:dipeptidyl aminopeptidase/acylaminoacyl peptidase
VQHQNKAQTHCVLVRSRFIQLRIGCQRRVHGGPYVQGGHWHQDPEIQFLASPDYAVLRREFRGSTGFGADLQHESIKQWGLAMKTDLTDGFCWAIAQGIAYPKRVCIISASYDVYATLMGLAQDPVLTAAESTGLALPIST